MSSGTSGQVVLGAMRQQDEPRENKAGKKASVSLFKSAVTLGKVVSTGPLPII